MKEKLLDDVVGDEDVGEAVAIIVGERYAQALAFLCGNSRSDADIFKCAVTAIVVQDVGDRTKFAGWAIGGFLGAARLALLDAPIEVAADTPIPWLVSPALARPACSVTSVKLPSLFWR